MNRAEARMQRAEGTSRAFTRARVLLFLSALCLLPSAFARATPTQEEVLKSIGDNVGESVDPAKLLGAVACIASVLIVIAIVNSRLKRQIVPKVLNHQGKLIREVSRTVNLKPAEIKQLRSLSEG